MTSKIVTLKEWHEWWTGKNSHGLPHMLRAVSVAGRVTQGIRPIDDEARTFKVFFRNNEEAVMPFNQLCKVTYEEAG